MAKATLPVNFKDDILNAGMDGKRKFTITQNTDGTYSIEDVTEYDQIGSNFGSAQINATNTAVNASADASKIIDDLATVAANTQKGYMAGALALKEVNQSFAQVALVNRGVLPTGADVNRLNRNDAKALTENSIYELNGTNTYSNLPAGVKWGFIEVVKCSGFVLERVITNNDLFMRILANSAWSNWWGYFTSAEIEAKHQTSVKMVTVSDLPVNKNTFQQTYKAHGLNVNKITSVESFVDGDSHCHVTKCWVDGSLLRWNVSNESDSVAVVTVGAYVRYLK